MNLNFINQEFDRLKLLEEFITFKFEPRSRVREGKRNIYYNDLKHDFEDEVNAYGFSPFIPKTYDEQKRDINIMRYKNKEKFNKGIMKNIKKKQEKEGIKIINYNLPSVQNENNTNKDYKNNNNNNQTPSAININSNGYCDYVTNNINTKTNSSKKILTQKESFLKKALDNMAKNTLNKSEDSQIFNMEKNDQITDNIIMEKEKTSIMSRNYLQRQVSQKKNSFNKKFSFENNVESKNAFGNIKKEIYGNKSDLPIELKSGNNVNKNSNNLLTDLQGPTVDFYKKRMEYLSNMFLNAKNNPFDYLESEENSIKKKFSKFIPKSATIFKERKENFNVHLIKKFSDFKIPSLENQTRSKTANLKNKIKKTNNEKELENKFNFNKSNSFDKDYGRERTKEIDRNNINFDGAMKITSSKIKKSQTVKITNHIFGRVSSNNVNKKVSSVNVNLNDILEKNKDEIKKIE